MSSGNQYLEFRFRKLHVIDLADGKVYNVPFEMREQDTPLTREVRIGNGPKERVNRAVMPYYKMDTLFRVDLMDETVYGPDPEMSLSQRMREEMEDEAYRVALDARRTNKLIRERLDHYVQQGVIEIVSDPFAVKMVPIGSVKQAPMPKPESETPPTKAEKAKVTAEASK